MGGGIKAEEHFKALKLVNGEISGVRLIDHDGREKGMQPHETAERGRLNRICWSRYESESYLLHPASLAWFIHDRAGIDGAVAVRKFFENAFGSELHERFVEDPFAPPPLVENYLKTTKARTDILGGLLTAAGIHGMDYTQFDEIAAVMKPDQIHPEVVEKLDFIQAAFGL